MQKWFLILSAAVLVACGQNTIPAGDAAQHQAQDIATEGLLEPQQVRVELGNCDLKVDYPYPSSSRNIRGYTKVNGTVTCMGPSTSSMTVRVRMFLQRKENGRWRDFSSGKLTVKVAAPKTEIKFVHKDANAFATCVPGTYRGRLWVDRSGSIKDPVIDPIKNEYGTEKYITCK